MAAEISGRLTEIGFRDVYSLRMPALGGASREELSTLGQCVAEEIKSHYGSLRYNEVREIQCLGRSFQFAIQPFEDREENGPDRGLVFLWPLRDCWLEPTDLGKQLRGQIEKIYTACVRKFADHSESRRILMLDPHGDVQFMGARWWNQVFSNCPPPSDIDEIWIGSSGTNDWGEEEWIIDKAFGGLVEFPALLPVPISK